MPKINTLETGSSEQRNSLNHQAIEDYLKTIYMLAEEESPVTTSRIAEARDVKPGSVTSMIQRLARLHLVNYEKHYGVTLTETGTRIALEVIRHHRLIELFLMEALGFGWDEVHEQADILEHVISEKLEERIAAALNYPLFDPHGNPIPSKDGVMAVVEAESLAGLNAGTYARVAYVLNDENSEMLRYLAELGLTPGTMLKVKHVAPFTGPITVVIDNEDRIVGQAIAQAVMVEVIE
ncbi:MAG: metal-dependent transcriptional regulator [Anaerolineales bacterium]|nr:metal-dependent transcriptional regulator [Anaerolineales bacterium]MCB8952541.1 metal-dependent transcriptional regulator [Ardenticatenales bacterium]